MERNICLKHITIAYLSPDLNMIENVRKSLKTRVQIYVLINKKANDLKYVLQEVWTALPLNYIRLRRIRNMIRARPQITK